MARIVPAKVARATERIAAEVGPGPGTLLELGSAGIHAPVLALLGWDVTVADEPGALTRARERAGEVATVVSLDELGGTRFDVVVGDARGADHVRPGGRLIGP
jgi:hypothetical protein